MQSNGFSVVRLFALGLLDAQPRYGYEVVAVAERWGVHRWAGVSIGATYHALGKLAKEGYVVAGKVEKAGNRPERQIWEITDSGRELVRQYVEHGLASLDFEGREIDMALAFAGLLPPDLRRSRVELRLGPLRERLGQLEHFNEGYESDAESEDPAFAEFRRLKKEHPWIHAGVRHGLGRIRFEEQWTRELLTEIDSWPDVLSSFEQKSSKR